MKTTKMKVCAAMLIASQLGLATQAFAAGYEKSIMWGGHSGGLAGIATPYMQGSEALYFNPAGLVSDRVGQDVSANLSLLQSQFKAPIASAAREETSVTSLSTPFGLIYGNTMNETWGYGVGFFVSGGSKSKYENVDVGAPFKAEAQTDLAIAEISGGVGYRVNENLKLGASYRVSMVQAALSTVVGTANVKVTDLKATDYAGFRLGAQYKLSDATRLGLTYRSELNFSADGNQQSTSLLSGSTGASSPATLKSTFPMAATLGAEHTLNEKWKLFGEYAWTQYSRVKDIEITNVGTIAQNWKDQNNLRVAAEYMGESAWPVRFGYGYTSQVTDADYARPTFTPPAASHTVTVGTGHDFTTAERPLRFDATLESTWAKGSGNEFAASGSHAADYSVMSYAAHLGLAYMF